MRKKKIDIQISYWVYVLVDCFGNVCSIVTEESGDIVQTYGLKNTDNEPAYFESEAYHLESYAKSYDMQFFEFKRDEIISVEIDERTK